MSQDGTYNFPEKTSITKGTCAVDHADSDAILQNDAGTRGKVWHKSDTASSASVHGTKKSPGALEGATGAKGNDLSIKIKHYIKDRETATALCHAILACDRADACEIMAVAFEDMSIGMPIAPLFSVMDEAGFHADLSTQDENKAYTLAHFNRMSPRNQAAFLGYVGGLQ